MLLLERWCEVLARDAHRPALHDAASGRSWSFAELDAAARRFPAAPVPGPVCPTGHGPDFIFATLNAWQIGRVVQPLEPGQTASAWAEPLPANIVHLKTTSASSGPARLVAFTGEQLAADADNIVGSMGLCPEWPNLAAVSLAHSYGFSNLVLPLLLHGIPLVLVSSPLPEAVRLAQERFPSVTLPGVPALWKAWSDADALTPAIRLAISAGAPLPVALERTVYERSGLKIHNFYGSSECGGIAYDDSPEPRAEEAFVGRALHRVELGLDDRGCLQVRGPAVGLGYLPGDPESLDAGVFRTADLADIVDGRVSLRGRAGDVINVAGRKLHPETVERALERHPAVKRCLVFGVPDRERSEKVVAIVHPATPVDAETLRQFLQQRLAGWQVPRDWWLTATLEADGRGKLSRPLWRDRFQQGRSEAG
jgi:acyl-CoA synthetase (AMP-forming)/AMP-acid ligase II